MAAVLVVNVVELLRWPGTTKDVATSVAAVDMDFADERMLDKDVDVALHLDSLSNGIAVTGTATAWWQGECRRCLRHIEEPMTIEVSELYQVNVEDPDAYPIPGDQVSLAPMVRENLLLSVPLAPLCRPDCAGLCPTCGINRNEATCECEGPPADPRWAALDQLKSVADGDNDTP